MSGQQYSIPSARPLAISLDSTVTKGLPNATECGHKFTDGGEKVVCKKPRVYYRDLCREGPACVDHLEAAGKLKAKENGEKHRARAKARAERKRLAVAQ